jgi:hypothetical protein
MSTFNLSNFKAIVSGITSKATPDDLKNEVKGTKYFSEVGVYNVVSSGLKTETSKAGNLYSYVPIQDETGRTGRVMVNFTDQEGKPQVFNLQRMLASYGYNIRQFVIRGLIEQEPETLKGMMDVLCTGAVKIKVFHTKYYVHNQEKGVFIIKNKEGVDYIDPLSQEVRPFSSREEAMAFAVQKGLKCALNPQIELLEPSPEFVMSKEQEEIYSYLQAQEQEVVTKGEPKVETPKIMPPWAK